MKGCINTWLTWCNNIGNIFCAHRPRWTLRIGWSFTFKTFKVCMLICLWFTTWWNNRSMILCVLWRHGNCRRIQHWCVCVDHISINWLISLLNWVYVVTIKVVRVYWSNVRWVCKGYWKTRLIRGRLFRSKWMLGLRWYASTGDMTNKPPLTLMNACSGSQKPWIRRCPFCMWVISIGSWCNRRMYTPGTPLSKNASCIVLIECGHTPNSGWLRHVYRSFHCVYYQVSLLPTHVVDVLTMVWATYTWKTSLVSLLHKGTNWPRIM